MEQWIVTDGATGKPIITGVDIPVHALLERLALWGSVERVMAAFPGLTREGFDAAIRYAGMAVQREVPYEAVPHVGVGMFREVAPAYESRVDIDAVVEDAEAAYERARYDFDLAASLRRGFGDLKAGRVMPHAAFMAELRAMLPA